VLKTLGAARSGLLAAFATALFGVAAGSARSQPVVAAAGAVIVTICLGLLGTWRALGRKPGPYLRDL
jgi:putative ABC transport system permease protein